MAVFAYVRVSKDIQVERGISLEEQERMIVGRAMEMSWLLTETFIERGVSASTPFPERPEGRRLMGQVRRGDIVIAAKLDRMFRSAIDCLTVVRDFHQAGISLYLLDMGGDVSGNGMAKVVLTMAACFAEFEKDRIGERIRDAKRHQRDAGKYLGGGIRFGFRHTADIGIEENPLEQAALATARTMRANGKAFRAIREAIKTMHGLDIGLGTLHRAMQPQAQS